jgi:hypothetical protein
MNNPAFDFLRTHKKVSEETESLVMKKTGDLRSNELLTIFEKGISGEYGKIYSLDPATLLGWVKEYRSKNKSGTTSDALLNVHEKYFEITANEWRREINRCYTAFLNGVSEYNFNPGTYDKLMLDGHIELNACMKYIERQPTGDYDPGSVTTGKQKYLRDYFLTCKSKGLSFIYFPNSIKES